MANVPIPKGTAESYKSHQGARKLANQEILDLFNDKIVKFIFDKVN